MEVIRGRAGDARSTWHGAHDLTLFTKGHPEEQKLKIDRSGTGRLFRPHGHREREGCGRIQASGRRAGDGFRRAPG